MNSVAGKASSRGAYYAWTKDFMEAGKERFTRDTVRDAKRGEIDELKRAFRPLTAYGCNFH